MEFPKLQIGPPLLYSQQQGHILLLICGQPSQLGAQSFDDESQWVLVLNQYSSHTKIRGISLNSKGFLKIWKGQHQGCDQCCFQSVKGHLLITCPMENLMLLEQLCQRLSNDGIVFHKFSIIPRESQETPKFFHILWLRPISYCLNLLGTGRHPLGTDDIS
jgi:hypothetical protein